MSVASPQHRRVLGAVAAPGRLPVVGPRRPWPRLAAAGLVLVLFSIGAAAIVREVTARPEVLVMARPVAYGEVIEAADLRAVPLADQRVASIPASRLTDVVGKAARATLSPGMVLAPDQVATGPMAGPGQAVAAAALRPGLFPVGLRPGHQVRVVARSGGAPGETRGVPLATGTVLSVVAAKDATGVTTVSVIVPDAAADEVSAAGAEGRISLVLVGGA